MYATTHVHTSCRFTPDNRRVMYLQGYEVLEHVDGWGPVPVRGSAGIAKSEIEETRGKPAHLLTEAEYERYLREVWPATYEYREELRGASLDSSAL